MEKRKKLMTAENQNQNGDEDKNDKKPTKLSQLISYQESEDFLNEIRNVCYLMHSTPLLHYDKKSLVQTKIKKNPARC